MRRELTRRRHNSEVKKMNGISIWSILIAVVASFFVMRWLWPRLPKSKSWREQFDEGRDAARARSEQIAEQSRQYQEIQKAKREGGKSGQDNG